VDKKHMERISSDCLSFDVKDVAGGAHVLQRLYLQIVVADGSEAHRMIQQCDVDTSQIGRGSHQIVIASPTQQRPSCEIAHDCVVLYLHQRHQVGKVFSTRKELLSNGIQLAPIASARPSVGAIWSELKVVFPLIVSVVEKILTVELNKGKRLSLYREEQEMANDE
jgi:hypothetical protein